MKRTQKYNRSEIMKNAKANVKANGVSLSVAMKAAWAFEKNRVKKDAADKLAGEIRAAWDMLHTKNMTQYCQASAEVANIKKQIKTIAITIATLPQNTITAELSVAFEVAKKLCGSTYTETPTYNQLFMLACTASELGLKWN